MSIIWMGHKNKQTHKHTKKHDDMLSCCATKKAKKTEMTKEIMLHQKTWILEFLLSSGAPIPRIAFLENCKICRKLYTEKLPYPNWISIGLYSVF